MSGASSDEQSQAEGRRVIREFFQGAEVYDVIPESSKVVVFDADIPVRLAFYALVEHELNSAPVWDAQLQDHVCMFTVSDFIAILRHFHKHRLGHDEYARLSIRRWREMKSEEADGSTRVKRIVLPSGVEARFPHGLVHIPPTATLYDAVVALTRFRIHRLPIVDPEQRCVLAVCTHMHALQFLVLRFRETRRLFDDSLRDLGIGSFDGVVTAALDDPLITVLDRMATHRVSGLPIVDGDGVVVDVYSRHYIIYMARERSPTAHLSTPVGVLLRSWNEMCGMKTGLQTCSRDEPLHAIFTRFAVTRVHRMVCVDDAGRCQGVVSLTDLLAYFLLPEDIDPRAAPTVAAGAATAAAVAATAAADAATAAAAAAGKSPPTASGDDDGGTTPLEVGLRDIVLDADSQSSEGRRRRRTSGEDLDAAAVAAVAAVTAARSAGTPLSAPAVAYAASAPQHASPSATAALREHGSLRGGDSGARSTTSAAVAAVDAVLGTPSTVFGSQTGEERAGSVASEDRARPPRAEGRARTASAHGEGQPWDRRYAHLRHPESVDRTASEGDKPSGHRSRAVAAAPDPTDDEEDGEEDGSTAFMMSDVGR